MRGATSTTNVHLARAEPDEISGEILRPASPDRFISVQLGPVAVCLRDADQAREVAAKFLEMADALDAKNALAATLRRG